MAENVFMLEMYISINKALNLMYETFPLFFFSGKDLKIEQMAAVKIHQHRFLLKHNSACEGYCSVSGTVYVLF